MIYIAETNLTRKSRPTHVHGLETLVRPRKMNKEPTCIIIKDVGVYVRGGDTERHNREREHL